MIQPPRPLHPHFGAELRGVKARPDLDAPTREALLAEVSRAGVVLLRDQDLDGPALAAFSESLGSPAEIPTTTGRDGGVFRISNLDSEGNILPQDHEMIQLNLANELWHTDRTFSRPRASYSMLYGRIIPPKGAETEYCDTRRAYERLPAAEQARLSAMTAKHSVLFSRQASGYAGWTAAQLKAYGEPLERPVVHLHEQSGRKALCIASYICSFSGLDADQSAALLAELIGHATASGEVYSHAWRPGDLLIWDNRCTMHRATPYDFERHKREMMAPARLVDASDVSA